MTKQLYFADVIFRPNIIADLSSLNKNGIFLHSHERDLKGVIIIPHLHFLQRVGLLPIAWDLLNPIIHL